MLLVWVASKMRPQRSSRQAEDFMQLPVYEDVVAAGEFTERSGKHAGLSIFKVWLRGNPMCVSYH